MNNTKNKIVRLKKEDWVPTHYMAEVYCPYCGQIVVMRSVGLPYIHTQECKNCHSEIETHTRVY